MREFFIGVAYSKLTPREKEAAYGWLRNYSALQIAQEMGIAAGHSCLEDGVSSANSLTNLTVVISEKSGSFRI